MCNVGSLGLAVFFLVSTASRAFAAPSSLQTNVIPVFPDGTAVSAAVGDVDGDGENELVAVSSQYNAIRIGRVRPDGTWTQLQEISLGAAPSAFQQLVSLAILDMNGDGLKDIVFWGRSNASRGLLYVLTQTSPGAYAIHTYPTPEADAAYSMAIADINGDGLPDVITANHGYSATANLFVLYNAPDATRFTASTTPPPQIIQSPSARIYFVYGADLNGDGRMDLFATTHPYGTPGLVVAYNQGLNQGSYFAAATILPGPMLSVTAGFGVLDPDGLPDLVTTDGIPNAYSQSISRYHGYSYASPLRLSPGNEPRSPRILDLNGDGVPDLVLDNTLDHTLAIYFGDPVTRQLGPSPFILTDPNLLTTDHGASGASDPLVVGDLDNNGVPDVVFALFRIVWIHRTDQTPPIITPTISGTAGTNGWYTSAVSVSWSVTDPESGISSSTGCGNVTLAANTAETVLTCSATNGAGLSATNSVTVRVDLAPPAISGMPAACSLWPPNGKLLTVATVSAADLLSGVVSFHVTGTSNEPSDPNNPDIVITGTGLNPRIVRLRADRLGSGNGRVYTLTATASDGAGNTNTTVASCAVPHDQGK